MAGETSEDPAINPPRLCDRSYDDLVTSGADSSMPSSYSPYKTFKFRVKVEGESSSIAILPIKLSHEAIEY